MTTSSNRRFALLEGYEALTEKEGVCLREANFDALGAVQEKKAKLLKAMESLEDGKELTLEQKEEFNCRLESLREQEDRNARELSRMQSENRADLKSLSAQANAASNVRKAYGSDKGDRARALKDRA